MSVSTDYAIPRVLWLIRSLRPKKVLDVACGNGKFGTLIRFRLEEDLPPSECSQIRIHGLDAVPTARTRWIELYDDLFIGDIRQLLHGLGSYDLIYFGDAIEHFEKEEGEQLLRLLLKKAALGVIVTNPYHFFEQGATAGSEFERHRSLWTKRDFQKFPHHCCWVEWRRKLVALVSERPIPSMPTAGLSQRPLVSSMVEHGLFSVMGFRNARRLKQWVTGVKPD